MTKFEIAAYSQSQSTMNNENFSEKKLLMLKILRLKSLYKVVIKSQTFSPS